VAIDFGTIKTDKDTGEAENTDWLLECVTDSSLEEDERLELVPTVG
jgi:hypothetical protein